MAKIKHTKNELKAQKEALTRYQRFLPMLQLKKQQLQAEIQAIDTAVTECEAETRAVREDLAGWQELLAEDVALGELVVLRGAETETGNIAGVPIPILKQVRLETAEIDLFATPAWVDEAVVAVGRLIELRVKLEILQEQRRRIVDELRVTSQRVNLFEKVKIPECKEHIRVIRIFLGDEQTAAVARGKIAKARV
jgi:V/A-type H+-transporting ATPase subunit D